MQRRNLTKATFAGAAIAAALPLAAKADAGALHNVVFTAGDTGHWAGVESLHVPVTTVSDNTLVVKTPHPMSQAHYIVSHSVVLEGGRFLGRQTFTPIDVPVSAHPLPAGYKGQITITSTCNLHDFWVKTITV